MMVKISSGSKDNELAESYENYFKSLPENAAMLEAPWDVLEELHEYVDGQRDPLYGIASRFFSSKSGKPAQTFALWDDNAGDGEGAIKMIVSDVELDAYISALEEIEAGGVDELSSSASLGLIWARELKERFVDGDVGSAQVPAFIANISNGVIRWVVAKGFRAAMPLGPLYIEGDGRISREKASRIGSFLLAVAPLVGRANVQVGLACGATGLFLNAVGSGQEVDLLVDQAKHVLNEQGSRQAADALDKDMALTTQLQSSIGRESRRAAKAVPTWDKLPTGYEIKDRKGQWFRILAPMYKGGYKNGPFYDAVKIVDKGRQAIRGARGEKVLVRDIVDSAPSVMAAAKAVAPAKAVRRPQIRMRPPAQKKSHGAPPTEDAGWSPLTCSYHIPTELVPSSDVGGQPYETHSPIASALRNFFSSLIGRAKNFPDDFEYGLLEKAEAVYRKLNGARVRRGGVNPYKDGVYTSLDSTVAARKAIKTAIAFINKHSPPFLAWGRIGPTNGPVMMGFEKKAILSHIGTGPLPGFELKTVQSKDPTKTNSLQWRNESWSAVKFESDQDNAAPLKAQVGGLVLFIPTLIHHIKMSPISLMGGEVQADIAVSNLTRMREDIIRDIKRPFGYLDQSVTAAADYINLISPEEYAWGYIGNGTWAFGPSIRVIC